jgi:hypothetical protein
VSTLDAALWGFGVPGLSVRTRVRVSTDLADPALWPGTEPTVQLLEGYAEYSARWLRAQVGRTHVVSRLGFTGFDGARADVMSRFANMRASVFGGWGLARGSVLPISSEQLNPLGDFIPTERQMLFGGEVGWSTAFMDAGFTYQRAIHPNGSRDALLAGDRGAADFAFRPARGWLVAGGADYDFARSEVNTADVRVQHRDGRGRYGVTVGGRYYRPYFDLWTIWGVFSPTPYWSVFGTVYAVPMDDLQVWVSGERYTYEDADIAQPYATVDGDGWRWSAGASMAVMEPLTVGAGYYMEGTHGAASVGFDAQVVYAPFENLAARASGGFRRRPLEYRLNLARVWNYGLRVDYQPFALAALTAEARRYDEERYRAGVPVVPFDQWRFNVGLTLLYGSGADRASMHPAVLSMPERRPS